MRYNYTPPRVVMSIPEYKNKKLDQSLIFDKFQTNRRLIFTKQTIDIIKEIC